MRVKVVESQIDLYISYNYCQPMTTKWIWESKEKSGKGESEYGLLNKKFIWKGKS